MPTFPIKEKFGKKVYLLDSYYTNKLKAHDRVQVIRKNKLDARIYNYDNKYYVVYRERYNASEERTLNYKKFGGMFQD